MTLLEAGIRVLTCGAVHAARSTPDVLDARRSIPALPLACYVGGTVAAWHGRPVLHLATGPELRIVPWGTVPGSEGYLPPEVLERWESPRRVMRSVPNGTALVTVKPRTLTLGQLSFEEVADVEEAHRMVLQYGDATASAVPYGTPMEQREG